MLVNNYQPFQTKAVGKVFTYCETSTKSTKLVQGMAQALNVERADNCYPPVKPLSHIHEFSYG